MPKITEIHWKKFERFVIRIGCHFERQEGDHRIYDRAGLKRPVTVPMKRAVPVFIIKNNLNTLGVKHNEYLEILKKI